ncbi:MAG: hypothetical protein L0Y44_14240 [Phycisphaerales bacterium]|nr:hypothetical protein [Phycisphaerales bacterium]
MSRVLDLIYRIPTAIAWIRACQLSSDQEHQRALQVIDDLPAREREKLGWRLLRLQQHFFLKDDQTVAREAPVLVAEIQAATGLTPDAKRYLGAYLKWLLSYDERGAPLRPDGSFVVENARFEEVDLSKVPSGWKEAFPLRSHPNWPANK